MSVIASINSDRGIHGCLLLRPLTGHMDERAACEALAPEKDVDCVTLASLCGCFTGEGRGFAPCTARACVEMLDYYGVGLSGRRAAVLGRSLVIGRPAAMLLLSRDATVTICHSRTPDAARRLPRGGYTYRRRGKGADGSIPDMSTRPRRSLMWA